MDTVSSRPEAVLADWADALAEGVVLLDGGRVRALNRAAATLLEVDAERAVGAPLIAVVLDHRIENAVRDGVPVEIASRGRRVTVVPIAGGLLLRDVTDARRSAEDARALLAVLSHELRTPVTTIRAALEALRFDLPEGQRQRYVARAEDEVARLGRLLEDLTVDVAPPRARSVALRDVAARVEGLLVSQMADRRVTLTVEVPATHAWADPDKLLQVVLNLVENAVLHGPSDRPVRLTAIADPERDGWWRVEVLDRGEPIAPAVMDGLFAPHTRGVAATSRGTGLGLYIVRSIAERWGGRAWGRRWSDGNAFGFSVARDRAAAR